MTLPGPSVSRPTDPGPSVPGPLKLAECSQYWKNQELTVQEVSAQELTDQDVSVQKENGKQQGFGGPGSDVVP